MEPKNCITEREAAAKYRVGRAKIRELVRKGILKAINIGRGVGRQQLRFTPEALAEFEATLQEPAAAPAPRRKRKQEEIGPMTTKALEGY